MQSIIRFFVNVWNAQRNADEVAYLRDAHSQAVNALSDQIAENAALRQQVSKRDSSGRFAPKNTGQ